MMAAQCLTCGQTNGHRTCAACGRHMLHTAEPWVKLCYVCYRKQNGGRI